MNIRINFYIDMELYCLYDLCSHIVTITNKKKIKTSIYLHCYLYIYTTKKQNISKNLKKKKKKKVEKGQSKE